MSELSDLTKASFLVRHSNGGEFRLAPIELADLGQLEHWIEDRPFRRVRRQIALMGHTIGVEERKQLMSEAAQESKEIASNDTNLLSDALESVEGQLFLMRLCLEKHNAEIRSYTDKEFAGFYNEDNIKVFTRMMSEQWGDDDSSPSRRAGKKKQAGG